MVIREVFFFYLAAITIQYLTERIWRVGGYGFSGIQAPDRAKASQDRKADDTQPLEKERPYRIVTEIQLPAIDYENFITDMLADRLFIEDHGRRCKKGEVWDCLLVRRRGQPNGVLVMPEDGCFVGWAAYFFNGNAREF